MFLSSVIFPIVPLQGNAGVPGLPGQKGTDGLTGRDGRPGLDGFPGPQVIPREIRIRHHLTLPYFQTTQKQKQKRL